MNERKQRGVKGKAALLVELSGSVGCRGFRWQESGTAAQLCFGVKGPPRLVSLYFIVKEKKGTETLEMRCRERERQRGEGLGKGRKKVKKKKKQTDPGAAAQI